MYQIIAPRQIIESMCWSRFPDKSCRFVVIAWPLAARFQIPSLLVQMFHVFILEMGSESRVCKESELISLGLNN